MHKSTMPNTKEAEAALRRTLNGVALYSSVQSNACLEKLDAYVASLQDDRNQLLDAIVDFLWDVEDFAYYDGADSGKVKCKDLIAAFKARFPVPLPKAP